MTSSPESADRSARAAISHGAGLLVAVLVVFAVAGAIWGIFLPRLDVTATGDGGFNYLGYIYPRFDTFVQFVVATAVLGAVSAVVFFARAKASSGAGMLVWLIAVMFLAVLVFRTAGGLVAEAIAGFPDLANAVQYEQLTVVLPVSIGLAAYFVGPFTAALAYWCVLIVCPQGE